mmetsp:Transcript_67982/g.107818  ORF Transcript_67982/g.107818 Transcript_67982/m.107818 type:complete len:209 (-) Transcript_67982:59-685(-)
MYFFQRLVLAAAWPGLLDASRPSSESESAALQIEVATGSMQQEGNSSSLAKSGAEPGTNQRRHDSGSKAIGKALLSEKSGAHQVAASTQEAHSAGKGHVSFNVGTDLQRQLQELEMQMQGAVQDKFMATEDSAEKTEKAAAAWAQASANLRHKSIDSWKKATYQALLTLGSEHKKLRDSIYSQGQGSPFTADEVADRWATLNSHNARL